MRLFLHILPALAAAAAMAPLSAQIIQVETREVPVDIAVTGRSAGNVELTAKDFSVWEDGKLQKINSVTSAASDPETSLKHFVLYFDFTSMSVPDQASSERAAAGFIDGLASPDRYMAVAASGGSGARVLQDFTAAPAALKNAVSRVQSSLGARGGPANPDRLMESLIAVCQSLAPAPGRKALLLFTGGYADFRGELPPTIKAPITACNRANVAIYVIAASGLFQDNFTQSRPQTGFRNVITPPAPQDVAASFANAMAEGTGGEALSFSGSLKEQLASVAREQDDYYRVFYTPPPSKDGACHAIRVAVAGHGLSARARKQYCTEKQVDVVAGKIAGQGLESRAAASGNTFDATMQLPFFYTGTNRAVVHLAVSLVPAGKAPLEIVGTVTRPEGDAVARFADTVDAGKSPYLYEHQFTVPAGSWDFQLAMGTGSGPAGKVTAPLKIDPWNAKTTGIGGIAFSTETYPVDPNAVSAAPVLEGRGPLIAGGRRFVPSPTNRFKRSDRIYFYTEVYDPAGDLATLRMQYRVLDRKTGEVREDTGFNGIAGYIHPGNPVVPFATRLAVGQLPPGAYRLSVRAEAAADQPAVERIVDFDLN